MVPESEHWTHHRGQPCLFVFFNTDALESIFFLKFVDMLCATLNSLPF